MLRGGILRHVPPCCCPAKNAFLHLPPLPAEGYTRPLGDQFRPTLSAQLQFGGFGGGGGNMVSRRAAWQRRSEARCRLRPPLNGSSSYWAAAFSSQGTTMQSVLTFYINFVPAGVQRGRRQHQEYAAGAAELDWAGVSTLSNRGGWCSGGLAAMQVAVGLVGFAAMLWQLNIGRPLPLPLDLPAADASCRPIPCSRSRSSPPATACNGTACGEASPPASGAAA
jgi:hypothetical protein